jgi:hypothetical protein
MLMATVDAFTADQCDEIACPKNMPAHSRFKPSGMERASGDFMSFAKLAK